LEEFYPKASDANKKKAAEALDRLMGSRKRIQEGSPSLNRPPPIGYLSALFEPKGLTIITLFSFSLPIMPRGQGGRFFPYFQILSQFSANIAQSTKSTTPE